MAREGIRSYEEIYNCQMVDMFNLTEVKVPCVHVKKGYVRFNMNALNLLGKTPFIEILVNPDEQYMLAVPCHQYDVFAVDWCRREKASGRMIPKDVRSKNLAPKLYRLMDWDEELTYRVQCFRQEFENGKCLLYFDLPNYVPMITEVVESKTGRMIKRSRPLYTTTQQSEFGPPLREMMEKLNRDYVGYYVADTNNESNTDQIRMFERGHQGEGQSVNGKQGQENRSDETNSELQ